jgi:hypothetical protein
LQYLPDKIRPQIRPDDDWPFSEGETSGIIGRISDSPCTVEEEATMKKKGKPNIPDFSRKRPGLPTPEQRVASPAPVTRTPIVKPHSTSSKSGRRGQ